MTIEYTNIYHPTLNSAFTLILNALAMNYSTTNADFSILKNGVDERITFIQHTETGFYNITKARNIVHVIKSAESEALGYSSASLKPAKYWFRNDATEQLIAEVKSQTGLDQVYYELKTGTPKKFAGTYVHELLVDHFLTWLDPKYGVRISVILKKIHERANREVITNLESEIMSMKKMLENASRERREILGEIKEARYDIDDLHNTVIDQHEDLNFKM